MAVRPVLRYPHPTLKLTAAALDPETDRDRIATAAADLIDTMEANTGCVGLAAPQLDELVRMIVIDLSRHRRPPEGHHGQLVLVNPRVTDASAETEVGREGCLSIPDFTANVRRAIEVRVEALDPA